MHISKLTLVNYRNFANATLHFNKGVNTIIGENGAGKTNIFRALRLLLDDNMVRNAYRMDESDFHRGLKQWRGHWIIISIELEDISLEEEIQALFLQGVAVVPGTKAVEKATYNLIFRPKKHIRMKLAELPDGDFAGMNSILLPLTIDDYETIFTGRSSADFSDPDVYKEIVGDFKNAAFDEEVEFPQIGTRLQGFLSVTKEVSLTFIQALRDVVSEFHNNRTNPLLNLLKMKSGELDPAALAPIVGQVGVLNKSIEALKDVQVLRSDIKKTIHGAAGLTYSPSALSIRSELPDEADKIFQSLKLFIGESNDGHEGPIHELSLGGANLIYLTLKLLEFKYQNEKQAIANFLLIEEPEAHLHTHVQKTLFDKIGRTGAQIIYSTHSTHISEVSNVKNVNVLGRTGGACDAFQPSAGLSKDEAGNIQRYLDAVRSNLLFAKSVLLVEGDAEQILLPQLIKGIFGVSLDELGISLVNIGSTGFSNVSVVFHSKRIRRRCSIITDHDKAYADTTARPGDAPSIVKWKEKMEGSQKAGAKRKLELDEDAKTNKWVKPFYAQHTFEVDFVEAGNQKLLEAMVDDIYVDAAKITEAKEDFRSGDKARYGKRVLTMAANKGKGWFAILLGKRVNDDTRIPLYIIRAIVFAHGVFSTELIVSILRYRLSHYNETPEFHAFRRRVLEFRSEKIDFDTIRDETIEFMPDDQVCDLLREIP